LQTSGLDRGARSAGPHHLVGAGLDVVHAEDVLGVAVAREVDHLAAVGAQRLADGEEHGVAEAAAREEHLLVLRDLRRRARRAHHHHGLAHPQVAMSFELAPISRPIMESSPFSGSVHAPVIARPSMAEARAFDHRREALEVLQPVELPGQELPRRRGGPHHHLDDGGREALHLVHDGLELGRERARKACHARRGRAARRGERGEVVREERRSRRGSRPWRWPWPSPPSPRTRGGCRRRSSRAAPAGPRGGEEALVVGHGRASARRPRTARCCSNARVLAFIANTPGNSRA
jgi:hypothetical protein